MRLLSFGINGRLVSTNFSNDSIPPYTILSHRWSESEVLFADLQDGRWEEKAGKEKIKFCADKTARDDFKYFWIDTCCIDKWNTQELSRSINSMFQWYRNAQKCYVFLLDVSVSSKADTAEQSTWEAAFRNSQWFTRGWTLQELIAPTTVEFFSREGFYLGNKESLGQIIHDLTEIPAPALRSYRPDDFSVDERRSWAKHRTTQEPEDRVYCLLGLLDVQMMISYGEGIHAASARLQVELDKSNMAPFILPFARNTHFVGRETQLTELKSMIFNHMSSGRLAIVGDGGTGKSQLALEFAFRCRTEYSHCAIFWINAGNVDSLSQSYTTICQKLNIPDWDNPKVDILQLFKDHFSQPQAGQWLMVYDNAETATLKSTGIAASLSSAMANFLPNSHTGCIIFTSTNGNVTEPLGVSYTLKLPPMTSDSAQRMLEHYTQRSVSLGERHDLKLLLDELLYLPLAIVQASAYINENGITLHNYLALLVRSNKTESRHTNSPSGTQSHNGARRNTVLTTLLVSLQQIRRHCPIALDCLYLAACLDPTDVPTDLFMSSSAGQARQQIEMLARYRLVTRRPSESAIDLHRLVHSEVRGLLRQKKQLGHWHREAIERLADVFPADDDAERSKWRRLLPHASYALSHGVTGVVEFGSQHKLMKRCGTVLSSDGRWEEAEQLEVQVMETHKTKLGADHPFTLTSMANLATTYINQGRWEEAEQLDVQVVETRKTKLGADHPDTLTSMANLASTYRQQGRWEEAEQLFVQVVETRKTKLGADHPDTLISMNNLALTYMNQGRWEEAEQLFVQVVETRKTKLGADHPDTLTSMHNLASTYMNQGRWEEAEQLFVQVVETRKTKLGADHPDTLTSMDNLASTYMKQGRWEEAEQLFVQVVETRKTKLGADHPDTLTSMDNLASTYRSQGREEEAEQLCVQVVETSKTKLGADHPDTLTSMDNLASTYWNQGRWEKAEQLEVQVMETRKTKLGADHPDTLSSMHNLASTYMNQGRWEEAEQLFVQVVETRQTKLGADHPSTLTSMDNLALTYLNQGRWEEAEQLCVQVVETSKTKLGADHPDTLISMNNLALTYMNQGRWEEAEQLFVQVVETRKTKLGADHPDTLTSMANLASTYMNQGRWEEAEQLLVQVVETSKTKLGADHPDTLISMGNLASTYRDQGRWEEAEQLEVQVMETRKTKLGVDHPDTLSSMHNLAYTWKDLGRDGEALQLIRDCVERRSRALGVEHPDYIRSYQTLIDWDTDTTDSDSDISIEEAVS